VEFKSIAPKRAAKNEVTRQAGRQQESAKNQQCARDGFGHSGDGHGKAIER
jgi:hypothetical protein